MSPGVASDMRKAVTLAAVCGRLPAGSPERKRAYGKLHEFLISSRLSGRFDGGELRVGEWPVETVLGGLGSDGWHHRLMERFPSGRRSVA